MILMGCQIICVNISWSNFYWTMILSLKMMCDWVIIKLQFGTGMVHFFVYSCRSKRAILVRHLYKVGISWLYISNKEISAIGMNICGSWGESFLRASQYSFISNDQQPQTPNTDKLWMILSGVPVMPIYSFHMVAPSPELQYGVHP